MGFKLLVVGYSLFVKYSSLLFLKKILAESWCNKALGKKRYSLEKNNSLISDLLLLIEQRQVTELVGRGSGKYQRSVISSNIKNAGGNGVDVELFVRGFL